jgi:starch phosphorylase
MQADVLESLRSEGYNPMEFYEHNEGLKQVLDMISSGFFCPDHPDLFRPIINSLLHHGDFYCLLADFEAYVTCQQAVSQAYTDQKRWTKMAILNVANSGKFSTDRTIRQYAEEIWNVKPVPIQMIEE